MTPLSDRHKLLLTAALAENDAEAVEGWGAWTALDPMESAPQEELRILPAVHARLSRVAGFAAIPQKLAGKARATFTLNSILTSAALDELASLEQAGIQPLAMKGFAHCLYFGSLARRGMGDIDIAIPESDLERGVTILDRSGWTACYGLTSQALGSRVAIRRESWNFTKGLGNIDLHWRIGGEAGKSAEEMIRRSAGMVEFRGRMIRVPSPEGALYLSMLHTRTGTAGDLLQLIVDTPEWLARTGFGALAEFVNLGGVSETYELLREVLPELGVAASLPALPVSPSRQVRRWPRQPENARLNHRALHGLWTAMGRPPWLERLIVRKLGPFSQPLEPLTEPIETFELRDCAGIDAVGGPGWGWPEPEQTCCWADGPDARLLLPLAAQADQLLVLFLSPRHQHDVNRRFRVYANGHEIAHSGINQTALMLPIRAHMLSGPWVELSLRPVLYRPRSAELAEVRTVAASRILVVNGNTGIQRLGSGISNRLVRNILEGDRGKAEKLARLRVLMTASPNRDSELLPPGFDALSYVLNYEDLFEAEVDPYTHYILHGRGEGRNW